MSPRVAESDLATLEATLQQALTRGDEQGLDLLGYGEISCVLRVASGGRSFACKRLPTFTTEAEADAYAVTFDRYLGALRKGGVTPVDSHLQRLPCAQGGVAVYCVQPVLPAGSLLPGHLASLPRDQALARIDDVARLIVGAVSPSVGLDGQLSNWAFLPGEGLRYLDVTTPMLRDEAGRDLLDLDIFMASLPWALRGIVKRLLVRDILDKYYDPRGVVLDLLGNMRKERLDQLLPEATRAIGALSGTPITVAEASRYYDADAGSWRLLQRLRHADRLWQRRVRRRVYPFLLPGHIDR